MYIFIKKKWLVLENGCCWILLLNGFRFQNRLFCLMDSQLFGMDILFCCLTRFGVLEGIRIGKDGCFNMLLVIILMFELIFNFSKSRGKVILYPAHLHRPHLRNYVGYVVVSWFWILIGNRFDFNEEYVEVKHI